MALPFPIRPLPTPAPKIGQVPAQPAQQKTSTFGYSWRRPPTSQPQPKDPIIKTKPGFLEKGDFRQHSSLVNEIKKDSYYKDVPTYSRKFTKDERVKLITELEKMGQGIGGLSGTKMGVAIKKMEKLKTKARSHAEFGKVKTLDQKIKQARVWQKQWGLRKN